MWTQAVGQREVQLTLDVSARPAERLRIHKGDLIRIKSFGGEEILSRVTKVSTPDEYGACTIYTEPA